MRRTLPLLAALLALAGLLTLAAPAARADHCYPGNVNVAVALNNGLRTAVLVQPTNAVFQSYAPAVAVSGSPSVTVVQRRSGLFGRRQSLTVVNGSGRSVVAVQNGRRQQLLIVR